MKKVFFFVIVLLLLISVSCNKENIAQPPASDSQQLTTSLMNQTKAGKHLIGEHFGGGVIFYLDKTGKHGLVAASEDFEEPAPWSHKDTLNGAKAAAIGAGSFNTNRIYATQGNPQFEADDYAAIECLELDEKGYSDWYLPSKNELNEMYKNKELIGGFLPTAYWSSSEVNTTNAWFQNFRDGSQVSETKLASYALRPVRSF